MVILQVNTATMKVLVSVHGMQPPPRNVSAMQSSSAAVLTGAGGHLVLPAHNSLLQFWDAARGCHVHCQQVCLSGSIVTHIEKQNVPATQYRWHVSPISQLTLLSSSLSSLVPALCCQAYLANSLSVTPPVCCCACSLMVAALLACVLNHVNCHRLQPGMLSV